MKITLSKEDLEDLVNRVYHVKSSGWDADGEHIIIDEVIEKLDPDIDFGFDHSFKPYLDGIWDLNRGISHRREASSIPSGIFSNITKHIPKISKVKK